MLRWISHHLSIGLLTAVTILLISGGQATEPAKPGRLIVTPSTGVVFFGHQGGPFSPQHFQYQVRASSGTIGFAISTPAWLTASPSLGVTDTGGVTITFAVSASALQLFSGEYGPNIAFKNVTNGLGGTVRSAVLKVQTLSPLIDGHGGYLLDDKGRRLLAK